MHNKIVLLLLLGVLLISGASAQEDHKLQITLKEAASNKEVNNVLVNIVIINKETGNERMVSSFVQQNPITMSLPQGEYVLIFKIDSLQTPGKDYYGELEAPLEDDVIKEAIVFPVGSLDGIVLDQLDNLVSKAILKISCNKEYGEKAPTTTDKVGSFQMAYAPIGECLITATSHNAVGTQRITVEKGMAKHLEIKLNKPVIAQASPYVLILIIIMVVAGGSIVFFLFKRYKKGRMHTAKEEKELGILAKGVEQPKEKHLGKRTQDVLNTLNEREKRVVTFLLEQNHQSTQAKIRYETGIPKTSLVRIFTSLQNKKVITIESIGKVKKIKLTDWFLEKED